MTPRFGVYQYQHLPVAELRDRWRRAEELGFDVLWNVDTVVDPDRPRSWMFDGPSVLVAMALETSRIRIGTLVTSLFFFDIRYWPPEPPRPSIIYPRADSSWR